MNFRQYCKDLHGLTIDQLPCIGLFPLEEVDIQELMQISQHTGMSVSEHAAELATLIKQENAITI